MQNGFSFVLGTQPKQPARYRVQAAFKFTWCIRFIYFLCQIHKPYFISALKSSCTEPSPSGHAQLWMSGAASRRSLKPFLPGRTVSWHL